MSIHHQIQSYPSIEVSISTEKFFKVEFYTSSFADIVMSCTYIKSGQQELEDYTNKTCKPELDKHVLDAAANTFSPMIQEAKDAKEAAAKSVQKCEDLVASLNIESIIGEEAKLRSDADKALEETINDVYSELNSKIDTKAATSNVYAKAQIDSFLSTKAPLLSPSFSGIPTTPTASGNNSLQITNITNLKTEISSKLSSNNLYSRITTSNNQWCREWFTDANLTQCVWVEQGGYIVPTQAEIVINTITFLRPYKNVNYHFGRNMEHSYHGGVSMCSAWIGFFEKSTTGAKIYLDYSEIVSCSWYACGI